MPNGGRLTVEISTTVLDRDYALMYPEVRMGTHVLIAVTDTGVGMTERSSVMRLSRFYTTKGTGAGTVSVSAWSYGFVKQSGGQISAL